MKLDSRALVGMLVALTASILVAPAALSQQVAPEQLKACHDYVWQLPQFKDIPNAGISVQAGEVSDRGNSRVHWRVDWDSNHAKGGCIVNPQNKVIKEWAKEPEQNWDPGAPAQGGIYFDTRSGKWRDSQGVCNTCTPGNGFPIPKTDGPFYYDAETRQWRDSAHQGAVCHTCTSENGFANPPR